MITAALALRDLVDHIDTRQMISDGLPAALHALVRSHPDRLVGRIGIRTQEPLGILLRLIEKTDMIRRALLAAGRVSARSCALRATMSSSFSACSASSDFSASTSLGS
jgi:hypothetical protein